ncbi:MAG: hypothetical protein IPJ85_14475 [Flavobacteriales bacterium]|nr:hypothetical protein [Flavobacteriales bacterium]
MKCGTRWAEGWNQDLPAFAGGPRRGGIAAHVPTGDVNRIYFGLGLHGSNRFKDWWVLNLPVGIEEHAASHVSVFPNPASDALQVRAPNDWTSNLHDQRYARPSHSERTTQQCWNNRHSITFAGSVQLEDG